MNIKEKILIASFAKLMMFQNYDIEKYGISLGMKKNDPAFKLLDEILVIDMKKPEIQYVLNSSTVLSLGAKIIITDYSATNISIQSVHGNHELLEEKLLKFDEMPLHSDKSYVRLANIMFSYNNIWGSLNSLLFKELKIAGKPDDSFPQQENFVEASREIVTWTILRAFDRFQIKVGDKTARIGLKRMLDLIADRRIDMNQQRILAIYEAFKLKPRLHPRYGEIAVAFSYLGFQPNSIKRIAQGLNYKTVSNQAGKWRNQEVILTQIFDNESETIRKFLINLNRVRTKVNGYSKNIKKSITVLEAIIKAGK